jgi:hypothetical protein
MIAVSSQGQSVVAGSQTGSGSAKLTHDLLAKLVEKVESGLSISGCCKGVGITMETFYQWLKDVPVFRRAIDGAEERFESKLLGHLIAHSKRDRHVTQWLLERRLRESYGESQVSTVNHNHVHAVLPGEFLQSIVAARSTTDTKLLPASSETAGVIEAEVIPSETVDNVS